MSTSPRGPGADTFTGLGGDISGAEETSRWFPLDLVTLGINSSGWVMLQRYCT